MNRKINANTRKQKQVKTPLPETAQRKSKDLSELTIMDGYMFMKVMQKPELLKVLLECILGKKIVKIGYPEFEKTLKEGYNARGVRLDVYVTDEDGVIYNIEAQTTDKHNLPKRMRYYQAEIDIDILTPGADYNRLRKSYVIFVANYDPYGKKRYVYSFENRCREDPKMPFGDDTVKVVVNTKGMKGRIRKELKEIIRYMDTGKVTGRFSRDLDNAVTEVKASEENRREFQMIMIRENELREEGKILGAIETMRDDGKDEETIQSRLMEKYGLSEAEAEEYLKVPA